MNYEIVDSFDTAKIFIQINKFMKLQPSCLSLFTKTSSIPFCG